MICGGVLSHLAQVECDVRAGYQTMGLALQQRAVRLHAQFTQQVIGIACSALGLQRVLIEAAEGAVSGAEGNV